MDRNHPFLLVLMITLFGIAIAAAIWIFGHRNIQVRRDVIVSGIQHIAADAFQYRLRPAAMGGGGGTYQNYSIPAKLRESDVAVYHILPVPSPDSLVIVATARRNVGVVTAGVDRDGVLTIISLTGELSY